MTNAKLAALFKQFPWLTPYKEAIGNPSVVKVQILDTDSIERWCGKIVTDDDYYWIDGHFFDDKGAHLGMVNRQHRGLLGLAQESIRCLTNASRAVDCSGRHLPPEA